MTTYFKAVRPDGGSFNDPAFKWALGPGGVTTHPTGTKNSGSDATHYLSVATVSTDCTGMSWPCRLLEVEPVGDVWTPDKDGLPNKRAGLSFRTVRELDAHTALGPQGAHLAAFIERCRTLTSEDTQRLSAARNAARYAAWNAARYAAWYAARYAAWYAARNAARYAARDAAWALVVRDHIGDTFTQKHYDLLTRPWRTAIGPIHPADEVIA